MALIIPGNSHSEINFPKIVRILNSVSGVSIAIGLLLPPPFGIILFTLSLIVQAVLFRWSYHSKAELSVSYKRSLLVVAACIGILFTLIHHHLV